MADQLVVPCFTDGPHDRLVISDDNSFQRALRAQMIEKDIVTNMYIDEERARELFNWLGVWLHKG